MIFGTFGIEIGDETTPGGETAALGGDDIDSLNGVTFFLRPRFFGDSKMLSGGLPSSDGSNNRVFCTSKIVDGMIGC